MTEDLGMGTTTTTEDIITIKGSGLRGAKRAAAKAHNARLRIALRPRDAKGRLLPMGGVKITNAEAAEVHAFETFVASLPGTVPAGQVHIDEAHMAATWTIDGEGTTHGHGNCPAIVGTVHTAAEVDGWICATCVHVPAPIAILARDIAPTCGTKACTCCHVVRKMTGFPTILVGGDDGFRDRGDTCRKCEQARRAAARAEAEEAAAA